MTNAIETLKTQIADAFAERVTFEQSKNPDNASIVKKLNVLARDVNHDVVLATLAACNYSAAQINAAQNSTHRANVYMLEKQIALARFMTDTKLDRVDQYSVAIVKSALALEANDIDMTRKIVASVCSAETKASDAKVEKIVKATRVAKHIAASTVSTQSSSSLCALAALDVIRETRNAANESVFKIVRDSFASVALAAKLELKL